MHDILVATLLRRILTIYDYNRVSVSVAGIGKNKQMNHSTQVTPVIWTNKKRRFRFVVSA